MSTDHHLRQISGWEFHDLGLKIQRYLCEALYATGSAREASYSILQIIDAFGEEVRMGGPTTEWAVGELILYLLITMCSILYHRFYATMSLHSSKQ